VELLSACTKPLPRLAEGAPEALQLQDLQQDGGDELQASASACSPAGDAYASLSAAQQQQLRLDPRLDVLAQKVQAAFRLAIETEMPEIYR
jgi:hypothetical protein